MRREFDSGVFGQEKDGGFKSALGQIRQAFNNKDLYASVEEKAAMLLYLVVKKIMHLWTETNGLRQLAFSTS